MTLGSFAFPNPQSLYADHERNHCKYVSQLLTSCGEQWSAHPASGQIPRPTTRWRALRFSTSTQSYYTANRCDNFNANLGSKLFRTSHSRALKTCPALKTLRVPEAQQSRLWKKGQSVLQRALCLTANVDVRPCACHANLC